MNRRRSATRALPLLAAIGTLALVLAGCGGGKSVEEEVRDFDVRADTTMTTAATLTKSQFVARVNRICRHAWVIVVDNFEKYFGYQDPKQSRNRRVAKTIQLSLLAGLDFHIFDNIYNLGAPPGEEKTIEETIGPFQAAVEIGQQAPDTDRLAQVPERFAEYNRRARRHGLEDCLVDHSHLDEIEV